MVFVVLGLSFLLSSLMSLDKIALVICKAAVVAPPQYSSDDIIEVRS